MSANNVETTGADLQTAIPSDAVRDSKDSVNYDDVKGLDNDDMECVYIAHISNRNSVFKFATKNAYKSRFIENTCAADSSIINNEKNPIILTVGSFQSFMVVVQYLDFYSHGHEEAPIPIKSWIINTKIEEIFAFEYELFNDIFNMSDEQQRMDLLRNTIILCEYLDIQTLYYKMAAMIAYYLFKADDTASTDFGNQLNETMDNL